MLFAPPHQGPGTRKYAAQSRRSNSSICEVGKGYELLGLLHVCALETGHDGDVDCLIGDGVDETLGDGVAAHDTA